MSAENKLTFRPLSLEDKKVYDKFAPVSNGYYGGEYNFATVWLENVLGETQIAEHENMIFVKSMFGSKRIFYPPLLKDAKDLTKAVHLIEAEAKREGYPLSIRCVDKKQAEQLDANRYLITTHPGRSDYVYLSQDLINLAGKKYHSKRNFITRFNSTYESEFREYNERTDRTAILALHQKWNNSTRHEKWEFEELSIERALDNYRELDLKIAVLYVEEKLVAVSVSQVNNNEIAYTFFEKADTEYIGAYQVINQRVAETYLKNVRYVNRQYDMNIDGLRKAKESYYPVMMIEKSRIQLHSEV